MEHAIKRDKQCLQHHRLIWGIHYLPNMWKITKHNPIIREKENHMFLSTVNKIFWMYVCSVRVCKHVCSGVLIRAGVCGGQGLILRCLILLLYALSFIQFPKLAALCRPAKQQVPRIHRSLHPKPRVKITDCTAVPVSRYASGESEEPAEVSYFLPPCRTQASNSDLQV